jgi:hypothetical protein
MFWQVPQRLSEPILAVPVQYHRKDNDVVLRIDILRNRSDDREKSSNNMCSQPLGQGHSENGNQRDFYSRLLLINRKWNFLRIWQAL